MHDGELEIERCREWMLGQVVGVLAKAGLQQPQRAWRGDNLLIAGWRVRWMIEVSKREREW